MLGVGEQDSELLLMAQGASTCRREENTRGEALEGVHVRRVHDAGSREACQGRCS